MLQRQHPNNGHECRIYFIMTGPHGYRSCVEGAGGREHTVQYAHILHIVHERTRLLRDHMNGCGSEGRRKDVMAGEPGRAGR